MRTRRGLTLVELLVVLIIIGLAVGLVAPAIVQKPNVEEPLRALVRHSRETAVRRAEVMRLLVAPSGHWELEATASGAERDVASGDLGARQPASFVIQFSPLGTCAPDLSSEQYLQTLALDPLTCETAP